MAKSPKLQKFLKKHESENKKGNKSVNDLFPKFSLEFNVLNDRSLEKAQKDVKLHVLSKLCHLSKQIWKEINESSRKKSGFEKIDIKSLKKTPGGIPHQFMDARAVDVFRLPAEKGRLIGFIEEGVFYIVWIDTKYDMYDH